MHDLTGLSAVVTGGNSGLGLSMAMGLGLAGAQVAIWARNDARNADAVTAMSERGIDAWAVRCDTSLEADVESAMSSTVERFGKVDILFANAGIADAAPITDMTLDAWTRVMRVNLDGSFLVSRAVARHLVSRGAGGSIVIVSSTISRYGGVGQAAYATSKTGLLGLGRTLAVELARHGVRCNVLVPGWTETAMNDDLRTDERFVEAVRRRTPVRRWADPDEFQDVAVFLADPSLTFHTGNEIVVDGGYTIY